MNKTLILTLAGALVATFAASAAFASPIIDKGDLGKYERKGRFVVPILNPAPRNHSSSRSVLAREEGRVIIDKGELGRYEREGRFVRRIMDTPPRKWSNGSSGAAESGVQHEHGLGGKGHSNLAN